MGPSWADIEWILFYKNKVADGLEKARKLRCEYHYGLSAD